MTMSQVLRVASSAVSSFRRDTNGSSTVEFVLWTPIFLILLGLVADASLIFGGKADILRVIQDTNRAVAIGRLSDTAIAEVEIRNRISAIAPNASITTQMLDGIITTEVSVPLADLATLGLVDAFDSVSMTISAQHLSEG